MRIFLNDVLLLLILRFSVRFEIVCLTNTHIKRVIVILSFLTAETSTKWLVAQIVSYVREPEVRTYSTASVTHFQLQ